MPVSSFHLPIGRPFQKPRTGLRGALKRHCWTPRHLAPINFCAINWLVPNGDGSGARNGNKCRLGKRVGPRTNISTVRRGIYFRRLLLSSVAWCNRIGPNLFQCLGHAEKRPGSLILALSLPGMTCLALPSGLRLRFRFVLQKFDDLRVQGL